MGGHSPAFKTYQDAKAAINEMFPKPAEGEREITVSFLNPVTDAEGKKTGDQKFYINSKSSSESIGLTISAGGHLKSATYFDKSPKESGAKATPEFVAKDFDKLSNLVMNPDLVKAAGVIDWSKVPAKEAEAPEAEAPEVDEPEI